MLAGYAPPSKKHYVDSASRIKNIVYDYGKHDILDFLRETTRTVICDFLHIFLAVTGISLIKFISEKLHSYLLHRSN